MKDEVLSNCVGKFVKLLEEKKVDDFDKLKEALEKGEFVALDKGPNGEIIFGGSFKNYDEVINSKYSSDNPEAMKLLPEVVFIRKEPNTWVLTNLIKKG